MNIFYRLWVKAKTGETIKDLGLVDEVIIRYKGYYISLLVGEDEIKSLGWTDNPMMFDVPVRQFWTATPPLREEKETK